MAIGGGVSTVMDDAVNAAVCEGVHFTVAAGGSNREACNSSPARATKWLYYRHRLPVVYIH